MDPKLQIGYTQKMLENVLSCIEKGYKDICVIAHAEKYAHSLKDRFLEMVQKAELEIEPRTVFQIIVKGTSVTFMEYGVFHRKRRGKDFDFIFEDHIVRDEEFRRHNLTHRSKNQQPLV